MSIEFNKNIFYGELVKGNLNGAVKYLKQFADRIELYNKYISVFEKEQYSTFEIDDRLNEILIIYQKYYREVFYLNIEAEKAAENMKNRFFHFFNMKNKKIEFREIEENEIAEAFHSSSFQFLGGKTGGYFGPYIWKKTELKKYDVELQDGMKEYTVILLSDFISKGWIDYISFGEVGTGGWVDGDGIINCIKESYNLKDESFQVSLLKHEAQHAMDQLNYKNMSSEDLEYRAKLVELIYSRERNLLKQFIYEADSSKMNNGHSLASNRIIDEFAKKQNGEELEELSIEEIRSISKTLFKESNEEVKIKYN
ncbi:MAG: hypothetical protein J6B85_09695 [Lachnospiraceae bacterium]|nr:hypothetical protein [Lachnospiraceae bacterium]